MSRFVVHLSLDEVAAARRAAEKRGDRGPKRAIGEKALAVGCRRRWDGHFPNLERWDAWKRLGRVPRAIDVVMIEATIADLELEPNTPDDTLVVLIGTREAPRFLLIGWAFAADVQVPKYWREPNGRYLLPHAELRPCWDLRRRPRKVSERIHPTDPADDFAGTGKFPRMLDTDDGEPPEHYGNVIRSKFALPCRRCQTMIPAGALSGGDLRTGTIHGDPTECQFTRDGD